MRHWSPGSVGPPLMQSSSSSSRFSEVCVCAVSPALYSSSRRHAEPASRRKASPVAPAGRDQEGGEDDGAAGPNDGEAISRSEGPSDLFGEDGGAAGRNLSRSAGRWHYAGEEDGGAAGRNLSRSAPPAPPARARSRRRKNAIPPTSPAKQPRTTRRTAAWSRRRGERPRRCTPATSRPHRTQPQRGTPQHPAGKPTTAPRGFLYFDKNANPRRSGSSCSRT